MSNSQNGRLIHKSVNRNDSLSDAQFLAKKLLSIKLFEDTEGSHWKKSVKDLDYELLCVSQFTLHARTNKGAKPDFHISMKGDESKKLYENFLETIRTFYKSEKVQSGVFGSKMSVNLVNDGPVTILLDSPSEKDDQSSKSNTENRPTVSQDNCTSEMVS
ncbi:uncharacterized protein LOC134854118 isoform X2 [Symsagittifera roscoffensis]|uniref:uncharacterized protein LOC134854118 isoform X2 n=1 Tax=Symsagittifera roscoffensis TaxID=84072 RepID=UPI00307B53D5